MTLIQIHPFHFPQVDLFRRGKKKRKKKRAEFSEPRGIWKRDSKTPALAHVSGTLFGGGCSVPPLFPGGHGAWDLPATLAGNSPKPERDVGFVSPCWERDSPCQDHQTGRDREEQQENEGTGGSAFSHLLSFLSSSSTPTRDVNLGCGQRCTILFPCSRDVTGR